MFPGNKHQICPQMYPVTDRRIVESDQYVYLTISDRGYISLSLMVVENYMPLYFNLTILIAPPYWNY